MQLSSLSSLKKKNATIEVKYFRPISLVGGGGGVGVFIRSLLRS